MYESYINLRQNIISWKKLGIDPKTALPVLGTLPTKVDFCGHGDAINMVPKSLNNGWDFIRPNDPFNRSFGFLLVIVLINFLQFLSFTYFGNFKLFDAIISL